MLSKRQNQQSDTIWLIRKHEVFTCVFSRASGSVRLFFGRAVLWAKCLLNKLMMNDNAYMLKLSKCNVYPHHDYWYVDYSCEVLTLALQSSPLWFFWARGNLTEASRTCHGKILLITRKPSPKSNPALWLFLSKWDHNLLKQHPAVLKKRETSD